MGEDLFGGITFDEFIRRAEVEHPQPRDEPKFLPWDYGHEEHGHMMRGKWGIALEDFVANNPAAAARIAAETAVDFSPAGVAKAATYDLPRAAARFREDPGLMNAADVFLSGLGALPGGATVGKLATIPFLARPTREGMDQARQALAAYDPQAVARGLEDVVASPENVSLAFMNPQEFLDLAPEFAGGRPYQDLLTNVGEVPPGGLSELPFLTMGSASNPVDLVKALEDTMGPGGQIMDPEFAQEMIRLLGQQYSGTPTAPHIRQALEQFERLGEGTAGTFAHEGRHRNIQAMLRGDEASPILLTTTDAPLEDIFGSPVAMRQGPGAQSGRLVEAPTEAARIADQLEVVRQLQPEFPYSHEGWLNMTRRAASEEAANLQRLGRQAEGGGRAPVQITSPRLRSPEALQRGEDIFGTLSDIRGTIMGQPYGMSFDEIMGIGR